ncbi:Sec-independent protein translocase subunit TatA/TatB [Archangium sp.]|uniref:Sec-independent protein translocase subunit TatA/TatB n=1 Tax=Archangium sp. TaxID=1872627 RepID=UPI002D63013E|nr:twin-arginine translocase TatA/TatE family subunit [Archangium sp.]HYO59611.1 twin-arginine translocase TatA/TatE family subunit [Archangium sp.]
MFNVGAGELIFIVVAALLILGPQKLPEFARAIGKFVREFRRQTDEVRTVVEREFYKMDQVIDEPRHQVHPPTPAALPSPVPAVPPLTPAATSEALAAVPAAPATTLEAAEAVAMAPGTPSPTPEPPAAGVAEPDALPRLEPVPGTVARNAPKSD